MTTGPAHDMYVQGAIFPANEGFWENFITTHREADKKR